MLHERNQTQKPIHHVISFIEHPGKGKITGSENRSIVARGWVCKGRLTSREHESNLGGADAILYLDYGGSHTTVCIY